MKRGSLYWLQALKSSAINPESTWGQPALPYLGGGRGGPDRRAWQISLATSPGELGTLVLALLGILWRNL